MNVGEKLKKILAVMKEVEQIFNACESIKADDPELANRINKFVENEMRAKIDVWIEI